MNKEVTSTQGVNAPTSVTIQDVTLREEQRTVAYFTSIFGQSRSHSVCGSQHLSWLWPVHAAVAQIITESKKRIWVQQGQTINWLQKTVFLDFPKY